MKKILLIFSLIFCFVNISHSQKFTKVQIKQLKIYYIYLSQTTEYDPIQKFEHSIVFRKNEQYRLTFNNEINIPSIKIYCAYKLIQTNENVNNYVEIYTKKTGLYHIVVYFNNRNFGRTKMRLDYIVYK